MKQEDKELLLKDLCARLPYNVMVLLGDEDIEILNLVEYDKRVPDWYIRAGKYIGIGLDNVKPYLRPLSSLTIEDKAELNAITDEFGDNWFEATTPEERWKCCFLNSSNEIDWLISHHFDFRELIEKGLALPAPEGMYNPK